MKALARRSALVRSLLACAFLFCAAQDALAGDPRVARVKIEGARAVSASEIRGSMLTRTRDAWRFWKPLPAFSAGVLEEDLNRIEQTYRHHGYYDARARSRIEERDGGERIFISITIEEKEPTYVTRLDIEVPPSSVVTSAELEAELPLAVGDVFAVRRYRDSRRAILRAFSEAGHPAAKLDGGVEVLADAHEAHVRFRVEPGPPVEFGAIRIQGLRDVGEPVVTREFQIEEGDGYSASALERTRSRLLALRLFRYVSVQPQRPATEAPPAAPIEPDATPGGVGAEPRSEEESATEAPAPRRGNESWPIVVELEERPPRSIALGGGWASGLGPRGSARWTHRNFFGDARTFTAWGNGSPLEQALGMRLLQPYVAGTQATLEVDTSWRRRSRDSYDANTVAFTVGPRRKLGDLWVLEGAYRFGWTGVENIRDVTNDVLREQRSSGRLSGLGMRARRAQLDAQFEPSAGTWLQLGAATNLKVLGSNFDWMSYEAEARGYLPIPLPYRRTVLAARVRWQAIDPLGSTQADEVPLGERLFLGGPHTGRGFPFEELGPLDANGEPVGGVSSLLASVEWRIPIYGPLSLVGFVDAGQVSLDQFGFAPGEIGVGTGAGIAFTTPIGPIAGYVAYPVRALEVSQHVRFSVTVGHAF